MVGCAGEGSYAAKLQFQKQIPRECGSVVEQFQGRATYTQCFLAVREYLEHFHGYLVTAQIRLVDIGKASTADRETQVLGLVVQDQSFWVKPSLFTKAV